MTLIPPAGGFAVQLTSNVTLVVALSPAPQPSAGARRSLLSWPSRDNPVSAGDKLVAYLWPESDAERARHVLNQLLYAQRRQFGEDGFFLKDAPEFERWVESQRERLARRMAMALAALAQQATNAGDHGMAANWWRRAGEIDAYDSTTALALVQSLAAAGDRAGALLAGRRHEERLQSELGVRPDKSFTEAMQRLR